MLSSPEKTDRRSESPFKLLPFADLQAVVMDLAVAIEELRYDVETLKERVKRLEKPSSLQ